jgi:glutamate dehydrogenase/leucine dehydrogenase
LTSNQNSVEQIDLLMSAPSEVANTLRSLGIRTFFFMCDPSTGGVHASHPRLASIAEALGQQQLDFQGHEGLFFQVSDLEDLIHGAFVHRTGRGQAQGGTRFWGYQRFADYLQDGIRLSQGMTLKNALAGIWWGGGKGVISRPNGENITDPKRRAEIFKEYGRFISSLRGCYITAEDVGTTTTDMDHIFSQTRFITCIPHLKGGSGNPSVATATGVVRGIQAGLVFSEGAQAEVNQSQRAQEALRGKRVVVQGVGHVGEAIVELLLEGGAEVIATDISPNKVSALQDRWRDLNVEVRLTEIGDMTPLSWPCDVLCPAATGAIINEETIPMIKAKLICGAANNQLRSAEVNGPSLLKAGITYVPDFLVNRMGIVNCANEQYGSIDGDPDYQRHLDYEDPTSVYQTTLRVLTQATRDQGSPHDAAVQLAEELSRVAHPIWGGRGEALISFLRTSGWAQE